METGKLRAIHQEIQVVEGVLGARLPASGCTENPERSSGTAQLWIAGVLFVGVTSAVFGLGFELERYQPLLGDGSSARSVSHMTALFFLLWTKSIVISLPILIVFLLLIRREHPMLASAWICGAWTLLVFWMVMDLLVQNVTGRHMSHWLPYVLDMLKADEDNQVRINWIKGWNIVTNTSIALIGVVLMAVGTYMTARWFGGRLVRKFPLLNRRRALATVTGIFLASLIGVTFSLTTWLEPSVLSQTCQTMPIIPAVIESLPSETPRLTWSGTRRSGGRNPEKNDLVLEKIQQETQSVWEHHRATAVSPKEADLNAVVSKPSPPNVLLIILDSFRHSALSPSIMKRLDHWSRQGLRLEKHYSGSNCTHLGLFTLMYGRTALNYDQTIDAGIPPQLCVSLRRSGYRTSFVGAEQFGGFRSTGKFINERTFDHVFIESPPDSQTSDWPDSDIRAMARIRSLLASANGRPQFVMAFLMSTHYPYEFPPEFALHQPCNRQVFVKRWKLHADPVQLENRYRNSALFLESELMKLIEELDPDRNIVVITGDHGESLTEDGWVSHATRASEIQTRTPFVMVGPGIKPRAVATATGHRDFLPTLLHSLAGAPVRIANSHGRDLHEETSPADETALVPATFFGPHEFLLVCGQRRLLFQVWLDRDRVRPVGFLDEYGRIESATTNLPASEDGSRWRALFRGEIDTLSGSSPAGSASPSTAFVDPMHE